MYDKNPPENGGFVSNLSCGNIVCRSSFFEYPIQPQKGGK